MSTSGSRGSFKSYLLENVSSRSKGRSSLKARFLGNELSDQGTENPKPKLLNGELIIRQAPNVLKFDTFSGQKRGITGSLTCTNFKISFVSANKPTVKTTGLDQRNALYKDNDIPLTFVRSIYQVAGKSKKQLTRNSSTAVSSTSKILEIRTKNFKVFTFSFKFTPEHDMKSIIQTILHHAYPSNINLLFAFAFQLPSDSESNQNSSNKIHAENGVSNRHSHTYDGSLPSIRFNSEWGSKRASSPPTPPPKPGQGQKDWTTGKTPTYRNMKDWQDETSRWGQQNLKVTAVNTDYMMCESLPEYFVVPAGLYDGELQKWAPCFIGHRVPIWCWSSSSGCSLFRMVHLNSEIDTDEATKRMLQSIADIHAHGTAKDYPVVTDLEKVCPSTKDILVSFQKLQDLCTVASMKEFFATETKWFSALENCKWLQHISACLERSKIVATQLDDKKSVVLRESSGRDLSCVISCLTQIMLDPYYRTQLGFQSLVQREWVATGHDFLVRSGHCSESTEDVSPVFLLFLDCVFQLMRQYPMAFEFNDTFLIILWDSLHTCIFDTFIFNNERHRTKVCNPNHSYQIKMVSVWAWTLQFSQVDQNLFSNPLYLIRDDLDMYRSKLDVAPLLNDHESCNTGIYRGIAQQSHKSPPLLSPTDGSQVGSVGERSSMASSGSQTSETKTVEAINRVLLPQCTAPCIQFWIHCYLRWVPSAHILGGGEVGIFHQYCCLIGEIQELFKRLEELNEEEQPSLKTRCHSEKLFLTSFEDLTKNQECLTSAFPFTNSDLELLGSDRQSFVSTSLAKFLQGQSLLDTDMDVPHHMTDASSDEVEF